MTGLFDSHTHYDDKKFDSDRDSLLSSLPNPTEINPYGVSYVMNAAVDLETSKTGLELSKKYDYLYFAVGVHPHEADNAGENIEEWISELIKDPKACAVGEIGLDYHYDFCARDVQRDVFERQLVLARSLDVPVIIHDREAHGDCMDILRRHKGVRGVFHSFSGSAEMAKEVLKLGYYISYNGMITFKNAVNLIGTVSEVPDDRLLIETDCPYLAPVPYRGERNTSELCYLTAKALADIRSDSVENIINLTRENAKRLFSIE